VLTALLTAHTCSVATCFEDAARRYDVPASLLRAIARQESAMNPGAVGHNANGSRDLGLMQINDAWLPTLAGYGITEAHLFDSCLNVHVGAWILADNIRRLGYGWNAVGAYNVGCKQLTAPECSRRRGKYITRIARLLDSPSAPVAAVAPALPGIASYPLDDGASPEARP